MKQRASVTAALVATLAGFLLGPSCGPSAPATGPSDRGAAPVADAPPPAKRARADAAADVPPAATRVVAVRVLTRQGDAPISGAHVTIATGGDEAPGPSASEDTDAEGRARVVLPADVIGPLDVTVRAAGYMRDRQEIEEAAPAEIVSYLDPAGRVRGVVRSAGGAPVEHATVYVEIDAPDDDPDAVETGPDGTYEVDGIPLGPSFLIGAQGNADAGDSRVALRRGLVVAEAGRPVAADLTLQEPASLAIRVQWHDGLPVALAAVEVSPGAPTGESMTNLSGDLEFHGLPAEHETITVRCWGFADTRTEIDLQPGERRTVIVRPPPGPALAGVVVDEDGRPVAEARVTPDADGAATVVTTAEGAFRIACPDATPLALDVKAGGFLDANVADVVPPSDGLRIVLRRLGKIRCRLIWPAGVARTERVTAWVDGRVTDAALDGDVLHVVVAPRATRVSFAVPGCVTVARAVDPDRAPVDDWGDVLLVAAPRLMGRVVDEGGKPVKAFVYASVGVVRPSLDSTDDDGAFCFDSLPPGDAEVRVEAEGFVNRTVHHALAAGCPPLTIALARGGGVRGVVRGAHGKPTPDVGYVSFVDVRDPENRERMAFAAIEEDGRFEVRLAPGRYRARTTLDDAEAETEIDVAEGKTSEITLKLAGR